MIARRCSIGLLLATVVTVTAVACTSSGSDDATPTRTEIARLLTAHGAAVRQHDHAAFASGLDGAAKAKRFRLAQEAVFDDLRQLPLSRWSYAVGPRVQAGQSQAAARRRYGPSAVIMRVDLSYALRGIDAVPAEHDLFWTFVRDDGKVVVAGDTDAADEGAASWKGPWDFGPLSVVRGTAGLVIGHPDNAAVLRTVADTVDAAVPAVTSVWGTGWAQRVGVVVPSTPDELAAAIGPNESITADVAAVAQSNGKDPVSGMPLEQRLIVEARPLARLSDVGRRIIVQHEITHIAAAADTNAGSPRWLVEGFADYVGNLRSGQPVGVAASELRADVRRGRVPTGLPDAAAFDASATAAQSYESSWLACRLIAERAGQDGLVRFYRAVGTSHAGGDTAVTAALRSVLHESPAQFIARWRAYLRAQLR